MQSWRRTRRAGTRGQFCALAIAVFSASHVWRSHAMVRPGECVVNGDCQSDPERLHGAQDWEGYGTHASGHSPSRYGIPAGRASAIWQARYLHSNARAYAVRGARGAPSARAGARMRRELSP